MNKAKYKHAEAFWMMTYTCQDYGHKEEIWGSDPAERTERWEERWVQEWSEPNET